MYQRILVPVDGSATANDGLAEAIGLAGLTGGRIRVVHVIDEPFVAVGVEGAMCEGVDLFGLVREASQHILAAAVDRVKQAGVVVEGVLLDTRDGRLSDLIVAEATRWPADVIVIGTHGRRGVGRMLLGSDAEQILRLAPVPVLLIRQPGDKR